MLTPNNIPWQLLILLALLLLCIALPLLAGRLALKLYRRFSPIQQDENTSLQIIVVEKRDGFLLNWIVGWIICLPGFYFLYRTFSTLN